MLNWLTGTTILCNYKYSFAGILPFFKRAGWLIWLGRPLRYFSLLHFYNPLIYQDICIEGITITYVQSTEMAEKYEHFQRVYIQNM